MKSFLCSSWICVFFLAALTVSYAQTTSPPREQRLFAPDSGVDAGDEFGGAMAADGRWAVVGARYDDSAALLDEGSVYVLKLTTATPNNTWTVHQKLTMPMTAQERDRQPITGILFGQRVAISGDWLAVSAPKFQTANNNTGRVVIYKRTEENWEVAQIIEPENSTSGSTGAALVMSRDRLAFASSPDQVHVYFKSSVSGQAPWAFRTTIDVTTNSGTTGIALAIRKGNLLMGLPGYENAGQIREYELTAHRVALIATISRPVISAPNALVSFGNSIAVSGDWLLASASNSTAIPSKVFSFKRVVSVGGTVTWNLQGNVTVPGAAPSVPPLVMMNDVNAVVTNFTPTTDVYTIPVTDTNGPNLRSLTYKGAGQIHTTRVESKDLYQSMTVIDKSNVIMQSQINEYAAFGGPLKIHSVNSAPSYHPRFLFPQPTYLLKFDGMGETVAGSSNLMAIAAPQWRSYPLTSQPRLPAGIVHLFRRNAGLWEYSDSIPNAPEGTTWPAFGEIMSINSKWLAVNGNGGVYVYRLLNGQAESLPSFTIRPRTIPNADLLNFEFDPLNESTLIIAWSHESEGTVAERFTMPEAESGTATFESALPKMSFRSVFPMAIENGLAAVADGSSVSVYDTILNPWKRISDFTYSSGSLHSGTFSDGLFMHDEQILTAGSIKTIGYEKTQNQWRPRWNGGENVISARRDAVLATDFQGLYLRTPKFERAYVWVVWKIGAKISLLKLGEKAARLRFDLIEPFKG
jgi:FG-GAP repeat